MLKSFAAVAAAGALALGASACGSSDDGASTAASSSTTASTTAASTKQPKVTLELALQSGCPFCLSIQRGAEAAAKEQGVDLTVQSPPKPDTASQVQQLSAVAANKPDVVILEPFDANALVAPIKQLVTAGSKAIMVDTDINDPSLRMSIITSDNLKGGQVAAEQIGKLTGGNGKVMYMGYTPGASTTDQRQKGFNDGLKAFPGLSQAKAQYAADDPAEVAQKVSATLRAVPDLKAVFAGTESAAIGTVSALRAAGKEGKVKVVAFDGAPDEVDALKRGSISTLIVQKAYEMGKTAVEQAAAYVKDGTLPPKLVQPDYVVVTKANAGDSDVAQYLYPAK